MKIAVLGGSFNPIHIAHLVLADCVCKELGYDKVLFVPTYIPPHKYMSDTTCAKERLKMVDLAVEHDSRFESENYEIKSGGVSYTWDTICYLEKKYEKVLTDKIGLILGFDLAPHFDRWKGALELSQKCEIILAVRPETKNATENSCFENKATPGYDDKIENFCEIPSDFNLSTEILKNCSLLFETLGAYFGILIEYKFTFNSNKEKFLTYNVKSRDKQRYNENSNPIKNLIVFLLLFFIEYIFFKTIIEFWIKNYFVGTNQFIAMSVELFFKGIFFFYIMKRLMSKICLLNNDIFSRDY